MYITKQSKMYGFIAVTVLLGLSVILIAKTSAPTKPLEKKLYPISEITHGHGLAVDPTDNNKIYIATHHGLLLLQSEKDLYQVGEKKDDYMGFSADPTNPKVFYSSGHPEAGGNIGFQKSEDGAYTWQKLSDGVNGPVDFHAMAVSPVDANYVYGWYMGNLQRSVDGGRNWTASRTSRPIIGLIADTKDKDTLYAVSPVGLQKSTNAGKKFDVLYDGFASAIAVNPTNAQHLISYSEKYQLAQSYDSGATWQTQAADFGGATPLFISFYKKDPTIVYLLTEKNSFYKSSNGGKSWVKIK